MKFSWEVWNEPHSQTKSIDCTIEQKKHKNFADFLFNSMDNELSNNVYESLDHPYTKDGPVVFATMFQQLFPIPENFQRMIESSLKGMMIMGLEGSVQTYINTFCRNFRL